MEFTSKKQCKKCKEIYENESIGMVFKTPRHSICEFCRQLKGDK